MTDVPGSGDGSASAQMVLVWVFLQCVDSNVDPLLYSFIMEKESVPSFNSSRLFKVLGGMAVSLGFCMDY